jgi:hypothetical protein
MEIRILIEEGAGGRYQAVVNGEVLIKSSRQPFFDGARELLRRGVDPEATLVMVRRSGVYSLRAKLGEAAKLAVEETRSRYRQWQPHYRSLDGQESGRMSSESD